MQTLTWAVSKQLGTVCIATVVEGPDKGQRVAFDDSEVFVGTADTAHLQLTDRSVSSVHCVFEASPNNHHVRIKDLGSKNGVWFGDCQLSEGQVPVGARIRVGRSIVAFEAQEIQRPVSRWTAGAELPAGAWAESPAMLRAYGRLARAASSDSGAILISGESGSGKELMARAVHELSPRRDGPFVVLDLASVPTTLADAEFFGHEAGAFTGAQKARMGAVERAHGGTLFLDEVGELPLLLQPKLLRFLDQGTVRRVGGNAYRELDVRVVAATHRSLPQMVQEQSFRADLFHRLAVHTIRLPPLRERGSDILGLGLRFLNERAPGDHELAELLKQLLHEKSGYLWPGNVRELRAVVRRLVVFREVESAWGSPPTFGDALWIDTESPYAESKHKWSEVFERHYFSKLLDECGGVVARVAERAGVNRSHLSVRLKKLGLRD